MFIEKLEIMCGIDHGKDKWWMLKANQVLHVLYCQRAYDNIEYFHHYYTFTN